MGNAKKKIMPLSLLSMVTGMAAVGLYGLVFSSASVIPFWVVITAVSLILPPVAKAKRLQNDGWGRGAEIVGLVLGGFAFYSVIFALTQISIYFGYLGWIVSGVIYKLVS